MSCLGLRPRFPALFAGLLLVVACGMAGLAFIGAREASASTLPPPLVRRIPDSILYEAHVSLAGLFGAIDSQPGAAASQWVKAAAHARSRADVDRAALGLAQARDRGVGTDVETGICEAWRHGAPAVRDAILRAGFACSDEP